MSALVDVQDICKVYNPGENEVWALDHVSVQIHEKEFVAIIGQSGSGKSTLMNMLGCLDVPTSGTYMLHGQDVSHMSDDELSDIRNKEIGFIFQGFNLIQNLTALENVELPLIYRGVGKKERIELAENALKKVGLEKRMDHKPSEMSGGQQQRVAIARAIAQAPPIILADEPTGNLDSGSSREIMQILKELIEESKGKSKGRKEKKKKEKKPRIKWKELPAEVRKKKRKRYIWIGVGVVILFFFIVSKISAANAKMPVTTEYVEIGDVESTISTSGKVESDVIKTYYSQIGGNRRAGCKIRRSPTVFRRAEFSYCKQGCAGSSFDKRRQL